MVSLIKRKSPDLDAKMYPTNGALSVDLDAFAFVEQQSTWFRSRCNQFFNINYDVELNKNRFADSTLFSLLLLLLFNVNMCKRKEGKVRAREEAREMMSFFCSMHANNVAQIH